jgi:chromosome segregation ATPase
MNEKYISLEEELNKTEISLKSANKNIDELTTSIKNYTENKNSLLFKLKEKEHKLNNMLDQQIN